MIIPVGYANAAIEVAVVGKVAPVSFNIGIRDLGEVGPQSVALKVAQAAMTDGSICGTDVGTAWSSSYTYNAVNVTYMTDTGPVQASSVINRTGTVTWATCPTNFSVLVQKRTARGGRAGRGRCFFPPSHIQESDVSAIGVIDGPDVEYMQGLWDTFIGELTDLDTQPVLLHNDALLQPDTITHTIVQSLGATQRRRMR